MTHAQLLDRGLWLGPFGAYGTDTPAVEAAAQLQHGRRLLDLVRQRRGADRLEADWIAECVGRSLGRAAGYDGAGLRALAQRLYGAEVRLLCELPVPQRLDLYERLALTLPVYRAAERYGLSRADLAALTERLWGLAPERLDEAQRFDLRLKILPQEMATVAQWARLTAAQAGAAARERFAEITAWLSTEAGV